MERSIKKVGFSEKDRKSLRNSKVENAEVSQYDFTYMERFVVYHHLENGKVFYKMLDMTHNRVSLVCKSDAVLSVGALVSKAYNAAKYTGLRFSREYHCGRGFRYELVSMGV